MSAAPDFLKDKHTTVMQEATTILEESDQVIKNLKKAAKSGSALPEISFDNASLSVCVKSMKGLVTDFKNFAKMFKD